jgi:DNA-binding NarL/FixJ family response regulator
MRFYPKGTAADTAESVTLSPRESEVLQALCYGMSNKEIADHLDLSPWTVGAHLAALLTGLGLHKRGELVRWAMENPGVLGARPACPRLHPEGCACSQHFCSAMRAKGAA